MKITEFKQGARASETSFTSRKTLIIFVLMYLTFSAGVFDALWHLLLLSCETFGSFVLILFNVRFKWLIE